ncbi:transposase (fragment) [Vibrio tapetis subsp. tapetis]|uniref:Transposase n=1 Tax=Vibrio tapetis subsp. tapetis TaxID=1671868 RepID=A0A2N8ZI17_9VIBR
MNLQMTRIEAACDALKLHAINNEWPALAKMSLDKEQTLGDFLESLLKVELDLRAEKTRATLTKFAGFPMKKTFEEYDLSSPLARQKISLGS